MYKRQVEGVPTGHCILIPLEMQWLSSSAQNIHDSNETQTFYASSWKKFELIKKTIYKWISEAQLVSSKQKQNLDTIVIVIV